MALDYFFKEGWKEVLIIIVAAAILGVSFSFPGFSNILSIITFMFIIIGINVIAKKLIAYYYEANAKTRFWRWYQYGFQKKAHFKKPIPMLWLPLLVSALFNGALQWFGILEFDITPKTSRVSRRHGLYRFSEMTEWHLAIITSAGIVVNIILAIIAYLTGFTLFAKLNIYYAFWSVIPLSNLDGSKILFGSRILWTILFIISLVLLAGTVLVV